MRQKANFLKKAEWKMEKIWGLDISNNYISCDTSLIPGFLFCEIFFQFKLF